MNSTKDIKLHDKIASEYDSLVKKYNSHIHELLSGMCFEYIKPGDSLLDLGIGTGLSSFLFAKAGLNITGLDGSGEMLKECKKKGIAKKTKQYNVVAGAKDKSSTLDIVRPTANGIKGSRFEVFEDSSHFLPMESPQELVDLLTSFIKDVSVQ